MLAVLLVGGAAVPRPRFCGQSDTLPLAAAGEMRAGKVLYPRHLVR